MARTMYDADTAGKRAANQPGNSIPRPIGDAGPHFAGLHETELHCTDRSLPSSQSAGTPIASPFVAARLVRVGQHRIRDLNSAEGVPIVGMRRTTVGEGDQLGQQDARQLRRATDGLG